MRSSSLLIGAAVLLFMAHFAGCRKAVAPVAQIDVSKPVPQTHEPLVPSVVQYSDMHLHPDTGDALGWDIQLRPGVDGYELTIFCGEGAPEGPVHGHVSSLKGTQTIELKEDVCGSPMTAEFEQDGIFLKAGESSREFVPRHANFLKQELFK